jgi:thiol-disulfide isomerase/thioredoxin
MKNVCYLFIVLLLTVSCKSESDNAQKNNKQNEVEKVVRKSKIASYDYNGLKPLLERKDSKTYVVNFWATWCAPCVKELPAFEKLQAAYKSKGVEVILVSLDFPTQVESHLLPFVEKKKLQSKVVLLDDPDQNTWIPKISNDWSGAIPATLIYNEKERSFYEQSFHYKQLEKEVIKFLK